MKKTFKKITALVLCFVLMGTISVPSFAAFDPTASVSAPVSTMKKSVYNVLDKVINSLVGAIAGFIPEPVDWVNKADYNVAAQKGTENFLDAPAQGAYWSMGFSSASILTGKELDGKHFVGGSLSVSDKTATALHDDLKVRVIAMSDNSGRGTAVFAVVDAYGLANVYVEEIRAAVKDFCQDNNVVSVNVAVLHQHSAVDTFGMNGSILKALVNPMKSNKSNGINDEYQSNMIKVTADCIKEAVNSMAAGTLYYGTADFSQFVTDKRDPQVLQTNFDRFRFVPNSGREIWFTTSNIHCVGNGAGGDQLTGDYPYYMEKAIDERYDADFIMMLTAEQGTSQDRSTVETVENPTVAQKLGAFGEALVDKFASIDNETEVAPLLNIAHARTFYKITNNILVFAGKMGLLTNTVVKTEGGYEVATEIGYMELGTDLAVALVPGEIAAELIEGGCLSAEKSWTGKDWTLAPIKDNVQGKKLIVFGIINDQIGYIIPDNDYMSILESSGKSLELVSTGNVTASAMVKDFAELIASVN